MIIYEDILKEFQIQKVKYVLVGGLAFNLLGGERSTSDLDILVEMSDQNLAKVVGILKTKGYHVKQPVDPMDIANKVIRNDWIKNKNMKAFNFYKEDYKEVDIIIESPVSFAQAIKKAICIKMDGLIIKVISLDHLIQMKKKANRSVDQRDIEQLNEIKKLKGRSS